jgi:predicted nucleic acid-binding protein
MDTYVVDTHVLVWFLTEDKRLSPMADQILTQAEAGEVQIFVPTLVLAEITHIAQKNRVAVTIHQVINTINQGDGFTVVSFDLAIFQTMLTLPDNWEIHDKIIAATACYYKVKLITIDEVLRNSDAVETVWD